MDIDLWQTVDRLFKSNDIDSAVELLERRLAEHRVMRFAGLIGASFTNSPDSVLSSINEFIRTCDGTFDIKAVYLEMNGFDINYDRWYFDSFGYSEYGGNPDDLEWLCDWQSPRWREVTLCGLENVQRDFAWYIENRIYDKDKSYESPHDVALLLVMAKYVALIQTTLRAGALAKAIPVLATAHDFDIVVRFEP